MFYATHDSDNGRISQNANIRAFDTAEQARISLLNPFDAADWDLATAEIGPGRFGDCWIKVHSAPGADERYFAPFARDQLHISTPGQHPGGKAWWIEPTEEVLVVKSIRAIETADSNFSALEIKVLHRERDFLRETTNTLLAMLEKMLDRLPADDVTAIRARSLIDKCRSSLNAMKARLP